MASILKYVLVDCNDYEQDWEEDDYQKAKRLAEEKAKQTGEPWAVIEREYEYADSALVFTTNGGEGARITWPPIDKEK